MTPFNGYNFRHMNGYGSHTFKMVNAAGDANYVKVKKRFIVLGAITFSITTLSIMTSAK
jgi:hypothetical protein